MSKNIQVKIFYLPNRNYSPHCKLASQFYPIKYRLPHKSTVLVFLSFLNLCFLRTKISHLSHPPGICPVRRELFTQCFDELIRQAAINCGERGLLLLRVRDEFRQTIAGYQSLYESSIAFGMRKALQVREK